MATWRKLADGNRYFNVDYANLIEYHQVSEGVWRLRISGPAIGGRGFTAFFDLAGDYSSEKNALKALKVLVGDK